MKTRAFAALATFSVLSSGAAPRVPEGAAEAERRTEKAGRRAATARLKIAVIPKGTTHEFWKSVHAGAAKAAKEVDVDIVWKGPLKEDDLKAQIDVVQHVRRAGRERHRRSRRSTTRRFAPRSSRRRRRRSPSSSSTPISRATITSASSRPTTSRPGKLAGEHMAKLLGDKGNVVVLRYQEGSASTQNREKGFLEAVKAKPAIKVVSDNQYGGATTESAFAKGESLLLAQKAETGAVNGIFTPNESTTFGMLLALKKSGVNKKVKFVGFDASEKLVGALEGRRHRRARRAEPVQHGLPRREDDGRRTSAARRSRSASTPARASSTKENLDDPAVKELIAARSQEVARGVSA